MFRSLIGGVVRRELSIATKLVPRKNFPVGTFPKLRFSTDGKPSSKLAAARETEDALMNAPLTVQEKASASFWLGLLALGGVCFAFTVRELWPTNMSPNSMMDEAFVQAKKNAEVVSTYGEPMKVYGIDSGSKREGRRNFIQSREYEAEDGTKRIKAKFNLQGPYGGGVIFAEIADNMDMRNGEWVYLVIQSKKTGQTITLCDNRQALQAASYAKTPEEKEALRRLLKGTDSF